MSRHLETTTLLDRGQNGLLTVRHLRASGSNQHIGQVMARAALAVHGADAGPHVAHDPNGAAGTTALVRYPPSRAV